MLISPAFLCVLNVTMEFLLNGTEIPWTQRIWKNTQAWNWVNLQVLCYLCPPGTEVECWFLTQEIVSLCKKYFINSVDSTQFNLGKTRMRYIFNSWAWLCYLQTYHTWTLIVNRYVIFLLKVIDLSTSLTQDPYVGRSGLDHFNSSFFLA